MYDGSILSLFCSLPQNRVLADRFFSQGLQNCRSKAVCSRPEKFSYSPRALSSLKSFFSFFPRPSQTHPSAPSFPVKSTLPRLLHPPALSIFCLACPANRLGGQRADIKEPMASESPLLGNRLEARRDVGCLISGDLVCILVLESLRSPSLSHQFSCAVSQLRKH